jgi:hypothetical protein
MTLVVVLLLLLFTSGILTDSKLARRISWLLKECTLDSSFTVERRVSVVYIGKQIYE